MKIEKIITFLETVNMDDHQMLITLSFIAVASYIAIIVFFFLRSLQQKRYKNKAFVNALANGIKNKTVEDKEDIINIYKGLTTSNSEDVKYRFGFSKLLRYFLVKLIANDWGKSSIKLKNEEIMAWKQTITKLIEENDKLSPYADLPEMERNILSDITSYLDNKDIRSTKRKMNELGAIIQTRYEEMKILKYKIKWSVPLSIIGLAWTIIFGLISYLT